MATLKDRTEELVRSREQSTNEAKAALALVSTLPEEIQLLDGMADTGYPDELLRLSFYSNKAESEATLRTLKMAGVQGLTPKIGYAPDSWVAYGNFVVDGKKVTVQISGLPKPPTCRIEEYEETVKKYRAICNETGEEIK